MRDVYRFLLTILTGLLGLWLILGFWPLTIGSRLALSSLVVLVCGTVLWRQQRVLRTGQATVLNMTNKELPPNNFQGAVILVCGDSAMMFDTEMRYRETRQGWYLQVKDADQLPLLVQHLSLLRPALLSQLSVLLVILPEHHHSPDEFTQRLLGWQRAVVQCQRWLDGLPPLWTVTYVSPLNGCMEEAPLWFTRSNTREGMQVHQPGQGSLPIAEWVSESSDCARFIRLGQALWLDGLLGWQTNSVDNLLTVAQGELPALEFCTQIFCIVPVSGQANSLWQQHIASITALPPQGVDVTDPLLLPELLLSALPRRGGLGPRMAFWRQVCLLGGIFLLLAMLASFVNNQRLIRSVADHLALYHRLSGEPAQAKRQAQQRLREDSQLLDDWQRQDEPLRYRMGLYQGLRLIAPVQAALTDWAAPASAVPVIETVVQAPSSVHLNSLSLFDSGKSALKLGSTKTLVNSLVGIRARPGWLIVVSGHSDNTGNPQLNQRLSRERAESVRDWMRDTGDVPESCFAVRGYGEGRPVATNDTEQGRAANRRVEISLVPQADACRAPAPQDPPND